MFFIYRLYFYQHVFAVVYCRSQHLKYIAIVFIVNDKDFFQIMEIAKTYRNKLFYRIMVIDSKRKYSDLSEL